MLLYVQNWVLLTVSLKIIKKNEQKNKINETWSGQLYRPTNESI